MRCRDCGNPAVSLTARAAPEAPLMQHPSSVPASRPESCARGFITVLDWALPGVFTALCHRPVPERAEGGM